VPSHTPLEIAASLIQQASTILTLEPGEGRCHFVDFTLSAVSEGEPPLEVQLRFIHGRKGTFKLEGNLPLVGEAALGQGSYPWMASGGRMVFKGVGKANDHPANPLAFAEPANLLKLQMAAGVMAGIAIAPHVLNQWLAVTDDTPPDGPPAIRVVLNEEGSGSLRLVLSDDRNTPQQVTFDVAGVKGTLTFRGWQTNTVAHPSMFDPPPGLPAKEVDAADLYRMFSAMFNFAVESAQ
jgi:hypothetical protein